MADFPAMPLWTDAFIADTQHLSLEEKGAYLTLLMLAWRHPDNSLPSDDRQLARMVGLTPRRWRSLKDSVMGFWCERDGRWRQKRLDSERAFVEKQRRQRRAAGRASATAKALKTGDTGSTDVDIPLQRDENGSATPIPTPIEEEEASPPETPRKRAARLPADWQPDEKCIAFARERGFPDDQISDIAGAFRDHWHASNGRNATKLDWSKTWNNWIRREKPVGRSRQLPGNGQGHSTQADRQREFARGLAATVGDGRAPAGPRPAGPSREHVPLLAASAVPDRRTDG